MTNFYHKLLIVWGIALVFCSALWFFNLISEQTVAIVGSVVTLSGLIYSWVQYKSEEAEKMATQARAKDETEAHLKKLEMQIEVEVKIIEQIEKIYLKTRDAQLYGVTTTFYGFYKALHEKMIDINLHGCSNEFRDEFYRFRENLKQIGEEFNKANSWNPFVFIPKSIKIWWRFDEMIQPLNMNIANLNKIIESKVAEKQSILTQI